MTLGVLAGCSAPGQAPPAEPTPTSSEGNTESSELESVEPSITREVPQAQRKKLGTLRGADLCGLVTPEELATLAFPVQQGQPREIGFDPPVRGCSFEAEGGARSVLVGAQPPGYGDLGREEVDLGVARGSQTLHVNDCTVLAEVEGATLQVAVTAAEADSDQCDSAQSVAQYTLAALTR